MGSVLEAMRVSSKDELYRYIMQQPTVSYAVGARQYKELAKLLFRTGLLFFFTLLLPY